MAIFNKAENKTRPLSSFHEESEEAPIMPSVASAPTETGELVLDSDVLDVDARLKALERKIVSTKRKLVSSVLDIGKSLEEAQNLMADHNGGAFTRWVRQRCGFTTKTAYRYLSAWRTFGGCDTVSQRRFELSAMYLLAHDSAPEPAVDEAIELASNGEKVSTKTAREIIAKYAPKAVSSKPGRPEPIIIEDAQAVVVIRPTAEGVEAYDVLARILRKMMAEQRAREAA